jgi:transcriptional regulator with XRE-family HTH domain
MLSVEPLRHDMRMAQNQAVGHFLRQWRKHRGLSMEAALEAAGALVEDRVMAEGEEGSLKKIGLSQPNLSRIETGKTPYNQALLEILAEVYQTDVPSLIMRDPSDPEGIWSIYDQIPTTQRPTALKVLSGFKTGTDG